MTTIRRTEVSAVLSEDFAGLLDTLGIRADFDRGLCTCDQCHDVVGPANVLLVFPKAGYRVGFLCKKPVCMEQFTEAAPQHATAR